MSTKAQEIALDQLLVARFKDGDEGAYNEMVSRYWGRIYAMVHQLLRNPQDAEEVTQDAFVRAFIHLRQYDDSRAFYPWLAAIAVRLAQNWLRQHGRVVRHEGSTLDEANEPGTAAAALSALLTDERSRRLWRAVSGLASGERTAVLLYYRDSMPIRDIASALGVTSGTVKTFLFRARRHLRERLTAEPDFDQVEPT